jgi:hypothetical protein
MNWQSLARQLAPELTHQLDADQQAFFDRYRLAVDQLDNPGPAQDSYSTALLDASQRIYDGEVARRESINTRCGALLATGGILGTLVVAAGQLGLAQKKGDFNVATWVVFGLFLLSLAYIGVAIVMALAVQGDRQGSVIDPSDLPPGSPNEMRANYYHLRLARAYLRYTIANYEQNNALKSRLLSGQRYLRNGIIAIIIAGMLSPLALRGNQSAAEPSHVTRTPHPRSTLHRPSRGAPLPGGQLLPV